MIETATFLLNIFFSLKCIQLSQLVLLWGKEKNPHIPFLSNCIIVTIPEKLNKGRMKFRSLVREDQRYVNQDKKAAFDLH